MGLGASLREWFDRRRETMVCRAAVELVTVHLDGAMDDRLRRRFEAHLAGCPACTAFLDQMRATVAVLRRLDPGDVDPDVRAALMAMHGAFGAC